MTDGEQALWAGMADLATDQMRLLSMLAEQGDAIIAQQTQITALRDIVEAQQRLLLDLSERILGGPVPSTNPKPKPALTLVSTNMKANPE